MKLKTYHLNTMRIIPPHEGFEVLMGLQTKAEDKEKAFKIFKSFLMDCVPSFPVNILTIQEVNTSLEYIFNTRKK